MLETRVAPNFGLFDLGMIAAAANEPGEAPHSDSERASLTSVVQDRAQDNNTDTRIEIESRLIARRFDADAAFNLAEQRRDSRDGAQYEREAFAAALRHQAIRALYADMQAGATSPAHTAAATEEFDLDVLLAELSPELLDDALDSLLDFSEDDDADNDRAATHSPPPASGGPASGGGASPFAEDGVQASSQLPAPRPHGEITPLVGAITSAATALHNNHIHNVVEGSDEDIAPRPLVSIMPGHSGNIMENSTGHTTFVVTRNVGGSGGGCTPLGLDLSMAETHAKRAIPQQNAEVLFEINDGDSFDVGSNFHFRLGAVSVVARSCREFARIPQVSGYVEEGQG